MTGKIYSNFFKRIFDIVCSLVGIILVAPLFGLAAWQIKSEDGGPIFYRGIRIGKNGKQFKIFKFRTMIVNAERQGPSSTAADDARVTQTGKWLRRYKLDELPQLINVFKGEMSIVGPRPQVHWVVAKYSDEEKIILNTPPGITDYASIKFHNEGEILKGSENPDKDYMEKIHPEKMRLAMEYVKNRSFLKDIKIIWDTLYIVGITRGR